MKHCSYLLLITMLFFSFSGCKKVNRFAEKIDDTEEPDEVDNETPQGDGDFMIVVIPDTQYYFAQPQLGGNIDMFASQIDWIKKNRLDSNIVYVLGVGDIVDHGDDPVYSNAEWSNAASLYYKLETPLPGLPHGIPYGLAVGNHDQSPNGHPLTGTTDGYNKYFGVSHFKGRAYYGGNFGDNNDCHYDLFTAGGIDFIVIYIEFAEVDSQISQDMNNWAYNLLNMYSDRKAIVVSHSIVRNGNPAPFSAQGQRIYDRLKSCKNVFLMLNGHHTGNGEGYRQDTYNGATIKSMLSNYQARPEGGGGLMRLLRFSTSKDLISVQTYSPYHNTYEVDGDSEFIVPLFNDERSSRTCDFNNDGRSEHSFFYNGTWKMMGMKDVVWGKSGDIPIPADFNGDGKTDITVFRSSTGQWLIKDIGTYTLGQITGDIPIPGDYNGDGRADIAIWRSSTATRHIIGQPSLSYGRVGDIPVPGDYNGDGKIDMALFRPSDGKWYIKDFKEGVSLGTSFQIPVPGDYNGDGKTDLAMFDRSTGEWIIEGQSSNLIVISPLPNDVPVPGDYFGDGRTRQAIYRPSTGQVFAYNGVETITINTSILNDSGFRAINLPYHIRVFFEGLY